MISLPYETILEKITTQSGLERGEIEARVKKKMDQLSGLISKEGAAHIIGNELNVSLFDEYSGKVAIKNILPGLRDVHIIGKVLEKYQIREFNVNGRKGTVANILLGDETGKMRVVLWGSATDYFSKCNEGDILSIKGAYAKENGDYTELHMNERSKVLINPEDVEVKIKTGNDRKTIASLTLQDQNVEVLGTLVELSEPRFYEVCSDCNKRVKEEVCKDHPQAEKTFGYVLNGFLDDGTDNIRLVCFGNQAALLLGEEDVSVQKYREDLDAFSTKKEDLLGSIIKVVGRVSKNELFDRHEFIVRNLFPADVKEELAKHS